MLSSAEAVVTGGIRVTINVAPEAPFVVDLFEWKEMQAKEQALGACSGRLWLLTVDDEVALPYGRRECKPKVSFEFLEVLG